jgi:hypothetical protein
MTVNDIYTAAGLNLREQQQMAEFLDWNDDFYSSSAFEKLYDYFIDEMPYNVQKCRDDTPDNWILEYLVAR